MQKNLFCNDNSMKCMQRRRIQNKIKCSSAPVRKIITLSMQFCLACSNKERKKVNVIISICIVSIFNKMLKYFKLKAGKRTNEKRKRKKNFKKKYQKTKFCSYLLWCTLRFTPEKKQVEFTESLKTDQYVLTEVEWYSGSILKLSESSPSVLADVSLPQNCWGSKRMTGWNLHTVMQDVKTR